MNLAYTQTKKKKALNAGMPLNLPDTALQVALNWVSQTGAE